MGYSSRVDAKGTPCRRHPSRPSASGPSGRPTSRPTPNPPLVGRATGPAHNRRTERDERRCTRCSPCCAFVVLTAGTAVFVAAEFSLTALERSTVDANARIGGRRDQLVQRAHRTLSFQLSGAQVGISITTLVTGYLAEPVVGPAVEPASRPRRFPGRRGRAGVRAGAADRHLGVDGVRRTGAQEPGGGPPAADRARWSAGPQVLFSTLFTPLIQMTNGTANWILRRLGIEPAEELRSARSPQELAHWSAARRAAASLDPVTAILVDRSLQFGNAPQRN